MVETGEFKLYLSQRGNRKATIKRRIDCLNKIVAKYGEITKESVSSYVADLLDKGLKRSYANFYLLAGRVYGDFIHNENLLTLKLLRQENYVKSTLNDSEIEAFLSLLPPTCRLLCHGKEMTRPVNRKQYEKMTMFWKICAFSGMRMGEVASLTVNSVDFGRNLFILENTKTHEPRMVPIAPNIKDELQLYVDTLSTEYLFPTERKGTNYEGHIGSVHWDMDFQNRIQRLGIKRKNLTPYSFRHSLITRLLEEDVSITKVMKIAGHKRIDTTLHYTHLTQKDIQEAIKQHPLVRASTMPQEVLKSLSAIILSFKLEADPRFGYHLDQSDHSLRFDVYIK